MSFPGFKARNHPQQVKQRRAMDSVDDRATTHELFDEISERHGPFSIDVAASGENRKCERYYSRRDNGLLPSWKGERVWCNPPFSNIKSWVEKAWHEWPGAETIVMLLPANRTEQGWWHQFVEPYRDRPGSPLAVRFIQGRQRFLLPGETEVPPNSRPPFGCCLLVWTQPLAPELPRTLFQS